MICKHPKYPDKPVCLVEAEKTAVICSAIMPECVWVAVGGKTQLGDNVDALIRELDLELVSVTRTIFH